ncbi:MAG: putative Ig domain-containing protein, partial [Cryobacterium sp.]|nr:putative Ig domain-containing protein [Cryobacterium sp.]
GGTGRNVYRFSSTSGHDLIGATQGEEATLFFEDIGAAAASARLEGRNLLIRAGDGTSVQVVGFADLSNAAQTWAVQFGSAQPISIATLLSAASAQVPIGSLDRRDRFLAQQKSELVTLPQRVFNHSGAVPRSVSEVALTADASGYLALPTYLTEGTQTLTTVHRSREPIYQPVSALPSDTVTGDRFISVSDLNGTTFNTSGASPVFGPSPSNSGGLALFGYFFSPPPSPTGPQYRIVGYSDVVTTRTSQVAADSALQVRASGADGSDYFNAYVGNMPTEFRGSIDTGGGDDYIYLNSLTVDFNYNYGGLYLRKLDPQEDWAPIAQFASVPPVNGYRERGIGAFVDAGDGKDFVLGTDAADTIIGGRGSDYLNGQAGADTYLIGRDAGSVDRIADLAVFRPTNPHDNYFLYGGNAADFHQDTVEFEAGIDRSRMSYKWFPNSGNELELYHDRKLFLQITYDRNGSAGLPGAAGIERFVFSNGEVFSLDQLRAALPQMPSQPPPTAPQVIRPLLDASVDEDAAILAIDVRTAFVDPQGGPLSFQVSTTGGKPLPSWLLFDAAAGRLTGVPTNDDVGAITVTVIATSASGLTAQDQFSIQVRNVNDAPTVVSGPTAPLVVEEGTTLTQTLDWFVDVDLGDALNISIAAEQGGPLPSWISFDAATKVLSALPPLGALGPLIVKVTATDSAGLIASAELAIDVRASAPMM